MPSVVTLLVQLAVIIATASAAAILFQKIGQPKVIGEMFAGIILGPSLLGWIAPQLSAAIFPTASLPWLGALSQVGIVLYMFLVGLAMNPAELREQRRALLLVSHASIVAPFVLGAAFAMYLYPRLSSGGVSLTSFALFVGAAMSITAFPVLARILAERKMVGTKLGSMAIGCAAVNDVVGWTILAWIVVLVRSREAAVMPMWWMIGGLLLFVVLMLTAGRRLMRTFASAYERNGKLGEIGVAAIFLIILLSALTTERLGLHLLFGAFLAGVCMPKTPDLVRDLTARFETVTVVVLLPLYFAFTGLRTSVALIHGMQMWLICAVIIALAIAGKFGGSAVAARYAGLPWRESAALGILMNTRGLMELVILNIGLDVGVISRPLFSMMVVMALVTTFMTAPLFDLTADPRKTLRHSYRRTAASSSS